MYESHLHILARAKRRVTALVSQFFWQMFVPVVVVIITIEPPRSFGLLGNSPMLYSTAKVHFKYQIIAKNIPQMDSRVGETWKNICGVPDEIHVLTFCEKKNVLMIEKNFWNSRLKFANHLSSKNKLFEHWIVTTIFESAYF